MRKRDINGNTVSRNENYLKGVLNNMTNCKYDVDSCGLFMVETGDGGSIIFYERDEPNFADMVRNKGIK
jgi:hypothetical protein